jgi:hypothetical protein
VLTDRGAFAERELSHRLATLSGRQEEPILRLLNPMRARRCCHAPCPGERCDDPETEIRPLSALFAPENPVSGKRRNLGTFKTRAEALRRERAVQFFKRR